MINYEAMVHPSMITHSSPTKVAIVGYDYDPQKADIFSNVLIEVMKHTSVNEVVILRNKEDALLNGQECSSHGPLFDVIIDPTSVEVVSIEYFASLYTCLKDDGVVSWLPWHLHDSSFLVLVHISESHPIRSLFLYTYTSLSYSACVKQ